MIDTLFPSAHGGVRRGPAIDPVILMALWMPRDAGRRGSARPIERLGEQHDAHRWLAGGRAARWTAGHWVARVEVLDRLPTTGVRH